MLTRKTAVRTLINESVIKWLLTLMSAAIIIGFVTMGLASYDFNLKSFITPQGVPTTPQLPSLSFVELNTEDFNQNSLELTITLTLYLNRDMVIPINLIEFKGLLYCRDHGVTLGNFSLQEPITLNKKGAYSLILIVKFSDQGLKHVANYHSTKIENAYHVDITLHVPEITIVTMVNNVKIKTTIKGFTRKVAFTLPEEAIHDFSFRS